MSNRRSKILRSEVINKELHGRLLNWGRYLRSDDTLKRLGYPDRAPFWIAATGGNTISEMDALHLHDIICGFGGMYKLTKQHAFILKVEYAEHSDSFMGPVEERAADVSRRYRMTCCRASYYNMLRLARLGVDRFVDPL